MQSLPDDQAAKHASLRAKYDKAVSDLLKELQTDPKLTYTSEDLTELRVSLGCFDPEDPNFIESNTCLFKPMSSEKIKEYSLNMSSAETRDLCAQFDERYKCPSAETGHSPSDIMEDNARTTFSYLKKHFEGSYKETKRNRESLFWTSKWDQIRDGNPFGDTADGLLAGFCHDMKLGRDRKIPNWRVAADYERSDDYYEDYDPETLRPHIMLVIYTGAVAVEGELLHCELGCITQVIRKRLDQKEFEKTSLFPVFIISLFGPRHGRLVLGKFNQSGILKIRASPIYSFVRKAEAPWTLFLRYYANDPRNGPEVEFGDDEEEGAPTQAPKYVPPVPGSDEKSCKNKDPPTKTPKPVLEPEKENAPPKEDETPSADES